MNLKKLHEAAEWQKLNESTFRSRATSHIIAQENTIEKLNNLVTQLNEDVQAIKQQIRLTTYQNAKMFKQLKNQKVEDEPQTKQKRDIRSVS